MPPECQIIPCNNAIQQNKGGIYEVSDGLLLADGGGASYCAGATAFGVQEEEKTSFLGMYLYGRALWGYGKLAQCLLCEAAYGMVSQKRQTVVSGGENRGF